MSLNSCECGKNKQSCKEYCTACKITIDKSIAHYMRAKKRTTHLFDELNQGKTFIMFEDG